MIATRGVCVQLDGKGRLVSSQPFEHRMVEIAEPLETKGELSRRADWLWRPTRGVVAGIVIRLARVNGIMLRRNFALDGMS
jgi:hypothetical protein